MKRLIVTIAVMVFGLAMAVDALAEWRGKRHGDDYRHREWNKNQRIEHGKRHGDHDGHRKRNQDLRIGHGIRTGELTRREAEKLKKEQWQIDRFERRAWADGRLSRWERNELDRMRDRASDRIYKFKHNERDRW